MDPLQEPAVAPLDLLGPRSERTPQDQALGLEAMKSLGHVVRGQSERDAEASTTAVFHRPPYGVVVTGDGRRGQTVQPAVRAISRPISVVPGSYIRPGYLTVSGWWPR